MKTIELTKGKVALVDDDLFEELNSHKWQARFSKGNYYASRRVGDKEVFMHNVILGRKPGYEVDHEDQNGLNDQRTNLRHSTFSQNRANVSRRKDNRSGYKGVCWHKASGRWRAYIQVEKKWRSLGMYKDIKEAALAYNRAAKEAFGEFAWLNHI